MTRARHGIGLLALVIALPGCCDTEWTPFLARRSALAPDAGAAGPGGTGGTVATGGTGGLGVTGGEGGGGGGGGVAGTGGGTGGMGTGGGTGGMGEGGGPGGTGGAGGTGGVTGTGGSGAPGTGGAGGGGGTPGVNVFRCLRLCLGDCSGVGTLTTHPQTCAMSGGGATPATVPSDIATDTGLTVAPGGTRVFRCNRLCPGAGCYGIGVLTTHPQFCSLAGASPPPAPFPATVASDTGLRVAPGATPVFRCSRTCVGPCGYGIGLLTTHPQFCSAGGMVVPPGSVPATDAGDTGLLAQ